MELLLTTEYLLTENPKNGVWFVYAINDTEHESPLLQIQFSPELTYEQRIALKGRLIDGLSTQFVEGEDA